MKKLTRVETKTDFLVGTKVVIKGSVLFINENKLKREGMTADYYYKTYIYDYDGIHLETLDSSADRLFN